MKRYDSHKDSGVEWIGEIPSHWNTKRLSYSFKVQKGKIPKFLTNEKDIDSYPYLSMSVLRGEEPLEFTKEDGLVFVDEGDIGLLWDGSNSGEVLKINKKGILSSTVSHLSLIDDNLNKNFTFYLLKFYERDFKSNTVGMGIPHVDGVYVKESKVLIPPLSEQQQIVSFLDSKTSQIDELIQNKERKIELLKEYRTSLINQVVTKGLNSNVEMKDSGVEWIGEIPSHWDMVKYKNLGDRTTISIGVEDFNDTDVIHYSIPNVQTFGKGVKEFGGDIDSSKLLFKGGELIISKLNPRKSCVSIVESLENEVVVGSGEFVVLTPKRTDIKFLFYFLKNQTFTDYLDSSVESVTRSHQRVNPSIIYNTFVPLPPLSEQQQIVEYLDEQTQKIDSSIQTEEKKIELLKEYRQSLISSVVTGKINVKTD